MEKVDTKTQTQSQVGENTTLIAAAILYFTALVLFSFWFTQS